MTSVLIATELSVDMLSLFRGFDFGDESYHRELGTWLESEAEIAMSHGTRLWAYATRDGDLVGYSSLGATRWNYPAPSSKKEVIVIIPAVAMRREFWGRPREANRNERYSSQIMRHLLIQAECWPNQPKAIGLYVHPENLSAINLYERFEFQLCHKEYRDKVTGVVYRGYVKAVNPQV